MSEKNRSKSKKQAGASLSIKNMRLFYAIIIIIAIVALYAKSVPYGYTYLDDNKFINEYAEYAETEGYLTKPLTTSFGVDYYRPILGYSFMFDAIIGGTEPDFFNISNIILHIIGSLLVFWVIVKLRFGERPAFLFALFFALHPILVPAVAWIAGRNDSLITIFVLSSFIMLLYYFENRKNNAYLLLHLFLYFIALLTKEIAAFLPIVMILYILSRKDEKLLDKRNILLYIGWIVFGIIWFAMRSSYLPQSDKGDVGFAAFLANLPTIFALVGKTFLPVNMVGFSNFDRLTLISGSFVYGMLLLLPFLMKFKDKKLYFFGFAWYFLFLIPSLMVRIRHVEDFFDYAEHRMYLPFLGVIIMIMEIAKNIHLSEKSKNYILSALILIFAIRSFVYLDVFETRYSYWQHQIEMYPDKARGYTNLAKAHLSAGNLDEAAKLHEQAYKLSPGSFFLNTDMAYVFLQKSEWEKAEKHAKAAVKLEPNDPTANYNLAKSYSKRGMNEEALKYYKIAINASPNNSNWYVDLCSVYFSMEDYDKAAEAARKAISLNSRNSKAYQNLGAALFSSGKRDEAHKAWLAAVAINPQDAGSLNNLVKYYILEKELDKARKFIERIEEFGGRVDPQVVNYFKNKTVQK